MRKQRQFFKKKKKKTQIIIKYDLNSLGGGLRERKNWIKGGWNLN